jgi:hypothetical protein
MGLSPFSPPKVRSIQAATTLTQGEIGVMKEQCLNRRIPDKSSLVDEIAVWESQRNAEKGTIDWRFTVDKAREKMARCYPEPLESLQPVESPKPQRKPPARSNKRRKKQRWIQPFKTPGKRY